MLKDIVKGGITLSFSSIFILIVSLFYTPIIARVLGPEGLGAMNLAILMTPWIISFSSFALESTATKLISEFNAKKKNVSPLIRDSFLLGFISGFICSALYYLLSDTIAENIFHDHSLAPLIRLSSLLIFTSVLYTTSIGIYRGFKKFRSYAIFESSKQIILVIVGLLLVVYFRIGVEGAIVALIVAPVLVVIYTIYVFKHHFIINEKSELKSIANTGFWIMIISTSLALFTSMDRLFLGYFESKEIVGLYVPALTITSMMGFFTTSIRKTMFPFISESFAKNDVVNTRRYLEETLKYSLMVLGLLLIVSTAMSNEIILLLFGSRFAESILIFKILLISAIFSTLYIVMHTFLVAIGEIKKILIPLMISIMFSIFTYFILIPQFHALGAASALVINLFVLSLGYIVLAQRKIDFKIRQSAEIIFLILFLMVVINYLTSDLFINIFLSIVFMILYIFMLFLLKIINAEEIKFVKEKIRITLCLVYR